MKFIQRLDFPHIGKILLLALAVTECAVYISLIIEYSHERTSLFLSICLVLSSATSILLACLSLPPKIYYYYTKTYLAVSVLAVAARIGTMIVINKLNGEPSE
jgi:hypothetical protein